MTEISMWDSSAEAAAQERTAKVASLAVAASEDLWPFLAQASTAEEFEHRLALSDEALTRVIAVVLPEEDPAPLRAYASMGLRQRFREHLATRKAAEAEGEHEVDLVINYDQPYATCRTCGKPAHLSDGGRGPAVHGTVAAKQALAGGKTEWEQDESGMHTVPDGTLAAVMGYPVDVLLGDGYGGTISYSGRISDFEPGDLGGVDFITEAGVSEYFSDKNRIEKIVKYPQPVTTDPQQMSLFSSRGDLDQAFTAALTVQAEEDLGMKSSHDLLQMVEERRVRQQERQRILDILLERGDITEEEHLSAQGSLRSPWAANQAPLDSRPGWSNMRPTGDTFTDPCWSCSKPVVFEWWTDGVFRSAKAVVPGSGSDHVASWCEQHEPRRRAASTRGPAVTALLAAFDDDGFEGPKPRLSTCANCGGQIEQIGDFDSETWRHTEGERDCSDPEPSQFLASRKQAGMSREEVRRWLLDYAWAEDTPADKASVVDCILSQDGWKYIDAVADQFASAQETGGGPEEYSEGTQFALSALYEAHDGPHLPSCADARARMASRRTSAVETLTLDGVQFRVDSDDVIGWMSDWGALYDDERDWVAKGYVTSVPHNSGGLGGASYRLTPVGKSKIARTAQRTAAGPIAWEGDTHFGASYVKGKATNGDNYEVYSNPNNGRETPCSWVNYGPEVDGDTANLNGNYESGRGFATMRDAMQDAERNAAAKTGSRRTAGVSDLSDDALLSEMIATQDRAGKTFDPQMRRSIDDWMKQIQAEIARRGLSGAPARRATKSAVADLLESEAAFFHRPQAPNSPQMPGVEVREPQRIPERAHPQPPQPEEQPLPEGVTNRNQDRTGPEGPKPVGPRKAVNEDAQGTERYQAQPDLPATEWVRDAWEHGKAPQEMLDRGRAAYQPESPFEETLTTVRREARQAIAGDLDNRLDGLEQPDDFERAAPTPRSTRPRVMPSEHQPGQSEMADNPAYAPTDPLLPTVGQRVRARISTLASKIRMDNPGMSPHQARYLAAATIERYPEMVVSPSKSKY